MISGKILNSNSDKITLDNLYNYNDIRDISLTKSGEFRDTITLDWNHGYSIYENNNEISLYLSKGDNLTIEYDTKNGSTLVFLELEVRSITIFSKEKAPWRSY